MTLLKWSSNMSVKEEGIDHQHEQLIDIMNRLHDGLCEGHAHESLQEAIAELRDYAATHFSREEAYFDAFGYPESASHKNQHRWFVSKIQGFHGDDAQLSTEVMELLADWLIDHIMVTDQRYSAYISDHEAR